MGGHTVKLLELHPVPLELSLTSTTHMVRQQTHLAWKGSHVYIWMSSRHGLRKPEEFMSHCLQYTGLYYALISLESV